MMKNGHEEARFLVGDSVRPLPSLVPVPVGHHSAMAFFRAAFKPIKDFYRFYKGMTEGFVS